MGNNATKDAVEEAEGSRVLDLSNKLTPLQYDKHLNGEYVEGNLTAIPWEIYYNSVSMYESVNVSFNFISSVPEELSLHVPHICHLNLSHNQLVSLPESFHLLLHLKVLDLSFNRLKIFPSSLLRLKKLLSLNLSHNGLREIPSSISKLQVLKKLNLSHNLLKGLPNSLSECNKLRALVVSNNELVHPPQAVCDQGAEATLKYLRDCHTPTPIKSTDFPHVFIRVRGEQVQSIVSNPESANVEYRQAQGTSRSNKRKCPLMPPAESSALSPSQLKDVILGLIYGAIIGDAMALNTEGLNHEECLFFYEYNSFALKDRIRDKLRSHFPANDWSTNIDLMLLTLDSLMRWGGVVDELELATQIDQWRIHGFVEIDPVTSIIISPLMNKVINTEGFAANPHYTANAIYKQQIDQPSDINTSDNSCLASAIVLGIPNFFKENEVIMNSERICKATHADPIAIASSIFVSVFVSELLKGTITESTNFESKFEEILETSSNAVTEDKLKAKVKSALKPDHIKLSNSDSLHTIFLLKEVLSGDVSCFKSSILDVVMMGGKGVCGHTCVIGGILGAIIGYSKLPQDWLAQLPVENKSWLNSKLNLLLDLFGLP